MNILRNFDRFSQGITLDKNGILSPYDFELTISTKTIGIYKNFNNVIIGLIKNSDRTISLLINNIFYSVDDKLKLTFHVEDIKSNLLIKYNGENILNITYERQTPISTLWYSEEFEDVDFGEWIYNILNSEERKNIFMDNSVELE
jgi:hypothetical protein